MLAAIAVVLAIETKSLPMGEAASPSDVTRIEAALLAEPTIDKVLNLRTMHIGPEELLVAAQVEVGGTDQAAEIAEAIDHAEAAIRAAVPVAAFLYVEPDTIRSVNGRASLPGVTPLVSVLTAVHAGGVRFLPEAYESLAGQDGSWEWVVQGDGVVPELPPDPRITVRGGRAGSAAVARNLALGHAAGTYIKVLDADDRLLPGVLARDVSTLEAEPELGWTVSAALDLMPDASIRVVAAGIAAGRIPLGALLQLWLDNDFIPPVHPATLCLRRELLITLGGWMALPAAEDTGVLLAANAVSPGHFIAEPGLLYRKWPGQTTAQPADPDERSARTRLIDERARLSRRSGSRFGPQ